MAFSKKRILFIEDENDLVDVYHAIFDYHDYNFLSTPDIEQGLMFCRMGEVDLVLLDILLPNKDKNQEIEKLGFVFLKELKADPKIKHIPVIVFTNLDSMKDRMRGRELGADDYFAKTEKTPQEVLAKVKELLDKSQIDKQTK